MRKITPKEKRKLRVRRKIKQGKRGRVLTVFRSNRYIWAQINDIFLGETLVAASSREVEKKQEKKGKKITKTEAAFLTGKELARRAQKKGIKRVVFDRSGYRYHGRVKALAEGARQGGLKF